MQILIDELPKSCVSCKYFAEHRRQCNLEICLQWSEDKFKFNDCPLQSIKDHDRELVKEVCEKIREFCENNKYRCNKYFLLYSIGLNVKLLNKNKEGQKETFYEFLDQLQKEFEK